MAESLAELARWAVTLPGWKWRAGMRTHTNERVMDVDRRGRILLADCGTGCGWENGDNYTPDLADPATLGCLLALVREKHGPLTHVSPSSRWHRGTLDWIVWRHAQRDDCSFVEIARGPFEVEALIAALEAP